jgi:serine/threonine protein kinase
MILLSIAGTPQFSAPELLENIGCYTEQVDIWSAGCIMHYLATGKIPYSGVK